jgi:hypothetical protein
MNENVHILKFDISHEIGGVAVEDNFRAEFYDLQTSRISTTPFEVGQAVPDDATRARDEEDHFEAVNTLHAQKQLRDWLFLSGGYFYAKLNADATFSLESIQPSDPSVVHATFDEANPITLKRESHVFNANARFGPWKNLTFTLGLQNEWTHRKAWSRLAVAEPAR